MQFLIFSRNNMKKIIIVTIIFSGLSILFGYLYDSTSSNYYNYQFPKEYVYVNDASVVDNQGYIVDQFDFRQEEQTKSTNQRGIDLNGIEFIRDCSNSLKDFVSEQVTYNHLIIPQQYTQIADGAIFNQNNLNVKIPTYDIDHLIVGKFPESDKEMLVSDLFALDIIIQKDFERYDDLLNFEFEGQKIVGVYEAQYQTEFDEIIIYGTSSKRDKASIILNEEVQDLQGLNNIEYLTAKDFSVFNWSILLLAIYILITIVSSVYILKNEIESCLRIMSCAGISKFTVTANLIIPLLIIAVCELIVIKMVITL